MQCNIDAAGKRVRLVVGMLTLLGAAVLAVLTVMSISPVWCWWIVLGSAIGGGMCVFEARSGWCALRAMGLKTPI